MSYRRLALFDQALFNAPDASVDVRSLVALCYHGIPDVSGLRALCWQILVGYLPPDRRMWARVLQSNRESYAQLVRGIAESLGSDPGDNGGSAQALLDQIRADIQRTMPDIAAFRNRIETSDNHEAHNNSKGGDNSNSGFRKDECDTDGDDDDDARCNTIVSDLTVLSMESAESCATIAPALPRRQHSSAALATHESSGFGAGCAVSRLRRALGEKIAAATAADPVDPSFYDNKNGVADTQIKHRLSRWLLSRPQTHAEALARILFVHARFNRGAGYVQGMNELLAPLYYVLVSSSNSNSKRVGGYRASECEADAFHMLILAMRDEHLDMFISAMDTTTTAHIPAPSPPRGSARHKAVHYSGISDRELDAQYRRAQNAANAHHHQAAAQVSAFALPVTAYNERNRRARRDSGACNKEAKRGGSSNVGGLQNAIRRWWDSYVRIADAQLWRRLEALGVHPEHFAVRWLLVWGAREFPLPDVLVLWDSLMANRARLAAAPQDTASLRVKPGAREAISRAMTSRAANSAHYHHHQHKESEYGTVRTHIGRLRCEVRMQQGVSGDDDGDHSQLGFLFDFFTAVLVAMRGQLLTAPFEKCIALLQQLPRDVPELEMHSLIESALRLRTDRAGRRAVQACTAVLSTVDRGCLGLGEPQGLGALYSLYGPSVSRQQQHRRRASRNAATTQVQATGLSGGKVSRFFGQLSGRIGQTVQTLLSQESDDETNNSSSSSSIDTASGRRWAEANSADVGEAQWIPECVFVVAPAAPGVVGGANAETSAKAATSRVAVYEMACFDRRSLTATVVLLGECDGLRPQLAGVQSAHGANGSTGKPTVVSVRLPAPYAVSPPPAVAAAATGIATHSTKHPVRVATTAEPGYRGAGAGIGAGAFCGNDDEELTATDPTQQAWWKSMEPVHTRSEHGRPTAASIELCDHDCDGDDVY